MQNLSGGTRFKCYPGPFSSVSYNGGFAKMLAREYILQTIMALINNENKNLISHLINDMKGTLKVEEIEDFLHEFLSYSEEEKHQRYAGMQNVLLELLKAQS